MDDEVIGSRSTQPFEGPCDADRSGVAKVEKDIVLPAE